MAQSFISDEAGAAWGEVEACLARMKAAYPSYYPLGCVPYVIHDYAHALLVDGSETRGSEGHWGNLEYKLDYRPRLPEARRFLGVFSLRAGGSNGGKAIDPLMRTELEDAVRAYGQAYAKGRRNFTVARNSLRGRLAETA